jgi:hypothetical protein
MILLKAFNVMTVFSDYLLDFAILRPSVSVSNSSTMEVLPLMTLQIIPLPTPVAMDTLLSGNRSSWLKPLHYYRLRNRPLAS